MSPDLFSRVKALFTTHDDLTVELVMTANGYAAVALAVMAALYLDWPLSRAVGVVPAVFLALGACLLFRHTIWIPAAAGGLVLAGSAALLGASLMFRLTDGPWLGAVLGAGAGLAMAFFAYRQVGRIARRLE